MQKATRVSQRLRQHATRHAPKLLTLLRYGLVQLVAYGIDMGTFLWLVHLLPLFAAGIGSRVISGIFCFICHKLFTFRQRGSRQTRREAISYFVLLVAMAPVASGLMVGLNAFADKIVAKVMADVLCVLISFLLVRYVVFRPAAGLPV